METNEGKRVDSSPLRSGSGSNPDDQLVSDLGHDFFRDFVFSEVNRFLPLSTNDTSVSES